MTDESGIYMVVHKASKKVYIGSAINLRQRFNKHRSLLRRGKHHNLHLQHTYDRDGMDAFDFIVCEIVPAADLLKAEQAHIDAARLDGVAVYNIQPTAGSALGQKRSESTRAKMAEIAKRRGISDATRKGIAEWQAGRPRYDETKRKISETLTGRKRDSEHARNNILSRVMNGPVVYLKSPDGAIYATRCVSWLARSFGMNKNQGCTLNRVVRGVRPSYKGWTLPTLEELEFAPLMG